MSREKNLIWEYFRKSCTDQSKAECTVWQSPVAWQRQATTSNSIRPKRSSVDMSQRDLFKVHKKSRWGWWWATEQENGDRQWLEWIQTSHYLDTADTAKSEWAAYWVGRRSRYHAENRQVCHGLDYRWYVAIYCCWRGSVQKVEFLRSAGAPSLQTQVGKIFQNYVNACDLRQSLATSEIATQRSSMDLFHNGRLDQSMEKLLTDEFHGPFCGWTSSS